MPRKKRKSGKGIAQILKKQLEPFERELALAYERINGNPINRLRWLLDFSEQPLDSASAGNLVNIGWEVAMFAIDRSPGQIPDDFEKYVDLRQLMTPWGPQEVQHLLEQLEKFDKNTPIPRGDKVSPALILHFQKKMKSIFEDLFSGKGWDYTYPPIKKRIALSHVRDSKGDYKANTSEAVGAEQLLELRAFELIEAEKERLMTCANKKCNRRFVATKKRRAIYHSPTCSAYVRIAKSRGKKI